MCNYINDCSIITQCFSVLLMLLLYIVSLYDTMPAVLFMALTFHKPAVWKIHIFTVYKVPIELVVYSYFHKCLQIHEFVKFCLIKKSAGVLNHVIALFFCLPNSQSVWTPSKIYRGTGDVS